MSCFKEGCYQANNPLCESYIALLQLRLLPLAHLSHERAFVYCSKFLRLVSSEECSSAALPVRREGLDMPGALTERPCGFVAMQLNRRPRKTLGFQTPAEKMAALINSTET